MTNFINELKKETNFTITENGAVAYKSTLNACLDAFGSLGAMRNIYKGRIIEIFSKAFYEDRETAMRMLFYMRDIRGGQGQRRVFREIIKWLAESYPQIIVQNLKNFLEFGRGDDLLCLLDYKFVKRDVLNFIAVTLSNDIEAMVKNEPCSLLAKWLPSENASSEETKRYARIIRGGLGYTPKQYRTILSRLRKYIGVVETKMSANKWKEIDYSSVPSKASINYTNAFYKHDCERYKNFVFNDASKKINAKALFPVDIVHKIMNSGREINQIKLFLYDAMWKNLPDYFEGKEETGICVVDVSGSMTGIPMEVAISLGMYNADKCRGAYKNHFITFSDHPELVEVVGENIVEKVRNITDANWDCNTNLEAVFDLILKTAIKSNCSEVDMPSKLYIISDMQFDQASGGEYDYRTWKRKEKKPFMKKMEEKYNAAGYKMPSIVYWNVRASNCGMFQQTIDDGYNCCMVSGYSPSLFKSIIEGTTYEEVEVTNSNGEKATLLKEKLDPMEIMYKTLYNERYDKVMI